MGFYNKLIYLIAWILQLPMQKIVPSTDLRHDLELDDYDFNMLIFRLEHYYKVEFRPEEINGIRNVQDLGQMIAAKESSQWSTPARFVSLSPVFKQAADH